MASYDSKYSVINENSQNLTTNLEILEPKKESKNMPLIEQNNDKKEIEMSLTVKEEKNIKDINQTNKINAKENKKSSVHNLLYGNPIDCLNPKYIGKCYALLYDFKGNPKLTIGPDCKSPLYYNKNITYII